MADYPFTDPIDQFIADIKISSDELVFPAHCIPQPAGWDKVAAHVASTNASRIVFDWSYEGFSPGELYFASFIMKSLIEHHEYNKDAFTILFGVPDLPINRELYDKCSKLFEYSATPVFTNNWEIHMRHGRDTRSVASNNKFSKKILCLNMQPRIHRLAVWSELMDRNLLDECAFSFYCNESDLGKFDCEEVNLVLPDMKNRIDENIQSVKHLLPIQMTLHDDQHNRFEFEDTDAELYESTLFSLINESVFYNNLELIADTKELWTKIWCYPCIFITEKTWNAIRAKHPFLIVGMPGFLKSLRDMGYKTFHPYINESYDEIENEQDRLLAVMDEVERLSNMSAEESQIWLNNIQDIANHNYERLMRPA